MKTLIEIETKELKNGDLVRYNEKSKVFERVSLETLNTINTKKFEEMNEKYNELLLKIEELNKLIDLNKENITKIAKILKGE